MKGLPSWQAEPFYEELIEEDQLKGKDFDLESWWTPWPPVATRTLQAGADLDTVMFALSVGAVPYVADQFVKKPARWAEMVAGLPALTTQAIQIWLTKTFQELGWTMPLPPIGTPLADAWHSPLNGHAKLHHLVSLKDWPQNIAPQSLWYFCDCLPEDGEQPPFSDTPNLRG